MILSPFLFVKYVTTADIPAGCQHSQQILNGESRGSTQANDATIGDADITPQGIDAEVDHLINNNKAGHTKGYKGQGEKLAEHTIVCP